MGHYRSALASGALKPDAAQRAAAEKFNSLGRLLARYRPDSPFAFLRMRKPPRGLYLWGDVGRGKSMLMDLFFEDVAIAPKYRVHFNAFMADVHVRLHAERGRGGTGDPIPAVAAALAAGAKLLFFDEFQV